MSQTFLVCASSLLALVLLGKGMQMRNLFLRLDLSFLDVAMLFVYMGPMFLLIVLPISTMISVFLTFLRMSTDRELVALKTGGIGLYQMLKAPAVFSFACLCIALFISLHGISWGINSFRATVLSIANTRAKIVLQPGVFNRDIFGLTLFARKVDPVSGHLQQVLFEDKTQDNQTSITILAPEGELRTDETKGELFFHLMNGRIYRVEHGNVSILEFGDYSIRLDLSSLLSGIELGELRPKEMSWNDLVRLDNDHSARSLSMQRKVLVEIHKRWALPVACLVLGLFALPLACLFEGVRHNLGTILALGFFLAYYSLFSLGLAVGESGLVPAGVCIWAANVFFFLAGLLGLHLVHKENIPSLLKFGSRFVTELRSLFRARKEKA